MAVKKYRASTGVDEFYYAVLDETGATVVKAAPERVKFLQTISVEAPQEPVRAYGDNTTAEIAVSSGDVSVTSAFHKLPIQDRNILLGLETSTAGLSSYGANDNPPYVACVFAKTHEDGSKEWVGLPKGIFLRPNVSGETKGEGVTFGQDEISAQFMDREVSGFNDEKSVIFGYDEKLETTQRDALFQAIFGQAYPAGTTVPEGV